MYLLLPHIKNILSTFLFDGKKLVRTQKINLTAKQKNNEMDHLTFNTACYDS